MNSADTKTEKLNWNMRIRKMRLSSMGGLKKIDNKDILMTQEILGEVQTGKIPLKGRTLKELSEIMVSLGEKSFRAKQIYHGLYVNRYESWEQFTTFSKTLKEKLEGLCSLTQLTVVKHLKSVDGTQKFTFASEQGKEFEAVWIPSGDGGRKTICISSQVGCTLNCKFCATAKLEFQGNLKAHEIVDQVLQVEKIVEDNATNVVFMGMGEPFHNYFNVIRAASILHDPDALNLGAKRITISTSGVVNGIRRFIENKEPYNFAISLNHPDPNGRLQIMDIEEKFALSELLQAAKDFTRELKRRITFEYVMIPGVNMGPENANKLVKIARSLDCKINVIPLNTEFFGWRRPTKQEVAEFITLLEPAGVPILNRRSPGKDIFGACGMLASKS
ncbi:23S rRNA m2A2503 methyltransferase [Leptospira borgpetersenii serovar Javanica str. UI 09931]|uniref:Probable dual-specificity RNA methyltransferase RlmN n=4 Tax=Leptospiraceae TaxID=170 RepID=A0A0S2IUI6_LEPBO|nr:23S rRNA m2A2503 methyltransferase [Leptospira borgpetersenii serovar Ballum]ANH01605.1 putative dual-specificity RNA methyltransferase RlmN [Leptospira borgpetersenii str. 4E]EKQ93546.1 23S rRNA m2A2503 methyltransferase [Leptospira borgpetersenii str. UI 09149]EKQ99011.1 23S rRNA m2A2503 methyltransferase [Leptospira borgpetersenii serovar Castellonis str. 200801910]EMK08440.1 23S rRNA m2A2503 methyltransferase [Leptospira sp. serovar Kenya str. Sh9]EMN56502.1 23S rRNA m2A2503 methyltrans